MRAPFLFDQSFLIPNQAIPGSNGMDGVDLRMRFSKLSMGVPRTVVQSLADTLLRGRSLVQQLPSCEDPPYGKAGAGPCLRGEMDRSSCILRFDGVREA